MSKGIILANIIKCDNCKDEIRSYRRHDYTMCKCRNVGVDGGTEYLRRTGKGYLDLSVYDDGTHDTRRNTLRWGRNYDKDMNKLPQTEYILIKDIETDHIKAIIDFMGIKLQGLYKEVLEEELKFRSND